MTPTPENAHTDRDPYGEDVDDERESEPADPQDRSGSEDEPPDCDPMEVW